MIDGRSRLRAGRRAVADAVQRLAERRPDVVAAAVRALALRWQR
jgi:hypothetical protein